MNFIRKICNIFNKDAKPINIIRLFALANVGVFVVATAFWLHPIIASWLNARVQISRQQQVYAAYTAQALQYPTNEISYPTSRILPYAYITTAMNDVLSLAQIYGLDVSQYTATEPIGGGIGNSDLFVEVIVSAIFTGYTYQAEVFTYELANGHAFIRNLHMEFIGNEMVILRIEFSLFGVRY